MTYRDLNSELTWVQNDNSVGGCTCDSWLRQRFFELDFHCYCGVCFYCLVMLDFLARYVYNMANELRRKSIWEKLCVKYAFNGIFAMVFLVCAWMLCKKIDGLFDLIRFIYTKFDTHSCWCIIGFSIILRNNISTIMRLISIKWFHIKLSCEVLLFSASDLARNWISKSAQNLDNNFGVFI